MEMHPWLQQKDFAAFHQSNGIHITQYSPLGNQNPKYDDVDGRLIDDPVLVEIGKAHGKTGAQVALAWGIAHGRSVIPKSKTESRIKENFDYEFTLTDDEIQKIDRIDRKLRFNDSSESFGWNFFVDLDGKK
jgi:alcohol dehydrogenase (NADP+)